LANFQNAEFSKIGKHLSDKLVTFSAGHILIMRRRDSNDEDKTLSYSFIFLKHFLGWCHPTITLVWWRNTYIIYFYTFYKQLILQFNFAEQNIIHFN